MTSRTKSRSKSRSPGLLSALTALAALLAVLGLTILPGTGHAAEAGKPHKPKPHPRMTVAEQTVAAMQPGWNLGNSLDATGADETSWGNPRITRELLGGIRDEGFNSIRIPVTWGQHQGAAPDYTIEPAYLSRVQEVVDWALDEGFYVMLNVHHDSWQWVNQMPTQHDTVLDRFTATWEQIAEAFRDAPADRLLFESINEPQFAGSSGDAQNAELLHELNTAFHGLVRDSGGQNADRLLVLPTLHTSADQARLDELVATFAELNDPNLIATFHYYGFWPFSVNVAGYTRFDAETQADLTNAFDRVYNTFVSQGVPVILGEYGLLGFDRHTGTIQQGEKLKFFEFLGGYARERQITTMWWDNGQHFDRTALSWRDQSLIRQIRSSWSVDSATAATDQIFVRAGEPTTDTTVALDLAGNSLTTISHDGTELVRGEDFTVSGDQLTFSAATLARLTEGGEYGTNAVLTADFSQGVPWDFHVITHDRPVLSDATGTTESFAIPTAFNGDLLATMEAVYADGGNAGPHDWTSYKEFDVAFAPDYTAGETTLTSTFFGEVRDGATVNLTFHYWSGETVSYTVTRSGTSVTGTAG
ncbi:cellulase family glycosylhydrolase [Streptomyces sp. 4N509B]|uniref:cellulase family glycosylhydrolase n=1 Tax=Streptomyces sp. 4N509B TaxID=3457413 RepID=UPI003FD44165